MKTACAPGGVCRPDKARPAAAISATALRASQWLMGSLRVRYTVTLCLDINQ